MECYINGIQYEMLHDFSINEKIANKASSDVSVLVENQPVPIAGDIIEIIDGNNTVFWGTCGIPKSPKYTTGLEPQIYNITCGNANTILSRRVVNEAYQNQTITYIVTDLYNKYVSAEGFSLGTISDIDTTMNVYTAKDKNLQDTLDELAAIVNAVWNVSSDKAFSFCVKSDFPVFPRTINSDFVGTAEFQATTKNYKQRTVQIVSGATAETDLQTEYFGYTYNSTSGEQTTSFQTSFPISQRPQIWTFSYASTMPTWTQVSDSLIGINGIDSARTDIAFLFSFNSNTVTYNPQSNYLQESNMSIKIIYTGLYQVRVTVKNDDKIAEIAALTGTSGLMEQVTLSTATGSLQDATALGNALLSQFSEATEEITFWVSSDQMYLVGLTLSDLDLLTVVNINLPQINISGEYIIVERTLTPFYGDMTNAAEKMKVSLRLMNRDYVKSYAETISALKNDVSQLSIRADDVIVNTAVVAEIEALTETVSYTVDTNFLPVFCTTDASGDLMSPTSLSLYIYTT